MLSDKKINLELIVKHPSITIQDVIRYPNLKWNWTYISDNFKLTVMEVVENINLPWNWFALANNNFLTIDFMFTQTLEKNILRTMIRTNIGYHSNSTFFEFLIRNLDKPLIFFGEEISKKNIFREIDNVDFNYIWYNVTINTPIKHVVNNPHKPWEKFSENPNITLKFIKDNLDKEWDWKEIMMRHLENDFIKYANKQLKCLMVTKILSKKRFL